MRRELQTHGIGVILSCSNFRQATFARIFLHSSVPSLGHLLSVRVNATLKSYYNNSQYLHSEKLATKIALIIELD